MDINQVFDTLDDLDNKKSKIYSAREQLSEKKSLLGIQTVSFENINSFLSNNLESLEKLEKMEKLLILFRKNIIVIFQKLKQSSLNTFLKKLSNGWKLRRSINNTERNLDEFWTHMMKFKN